MMQKQDEPVEITDIDKLFAYDLSRDCYTVEILRKGGVLDGEHILTVCLLDGENESDWGEPFIEGDNCYIPPDILKNIYEELKQWREQSGDHLKLFT